MKLPQISCFSQGTLDLQRVKNLLKKEKSYFRVCFILLLIILNHFGSFLRPLVENHCSRVSKEISILSQIVIRSAIKRDFNMNFSAKMFVALFLQLVLLIQLNRQGIALAMPRSWVRFLGTTCTDKHILSFFGEKCPSNTNNFKFLCYLSSFDF